MEILFQLRKNFSLSIFFKKFEVNTPTFSYDAFAFDILCRMFVNFRVESRNPRNLFLAKFKILPDLY